MADVVGAALDDFVGAVINKKDDAAFLGLVDREFLDTELRLLKDKVEQYRTNQQLQAREKGELNDRLASELSNQKDIFMYLNGELAKKTDEILELQERVQQLLDENERQTLDHEQRMQAEKDSAQLNAAKLQEEINQHKASLAKVHKFIAEKSELEGKLLESTRALEESTASHQTLVSDLERKHVQEKDRLKKEMLMKLRETKANLLKMTDNQLDTTTKRTIAENEQMSSELAWQSRETEKLIRRNDKLSGENASLKRELALNRQAEEEMAKKVNVYQKTIQTLMTKLSSVGAEHDAELSRRDAQGEDAERDRTELLQEKDIMVEQLEEVTQRLQMSAEAYAHLEGEHRELEAKHGHVLQLQDEAVKFTLQCLEDSRGQPQPPGGDLLSAADAAAANEASSLATLDASRRETVLAYLLEQLNAYQNQLRELELHNAWRHHTSAAQQASHVGGMGATTGAGGAKLPPIAQTGSQGALRGVAPPTQAGGEVLQMSVGSAVKPWGQRRGHSGSRR